MWDKIVKLIFKFDENSGKYLKYFLNFFKQNYPHNLLEFIVA